MKIYISGPITGWPNYEERFESAEELLHQGGYDVINPADALAYMPKSTSHEEYMAKSFELLKECDGIYMLDGWEKSAGARTEFEFAKEHKLTICFQ